MRQKKTKYKIQNIDIDDNGNNQKFWGSISDAFFSFYFIRPAYQRVKKNIYYTSVVCDQK